MTVTTVQHWDSAAYEKAVRASERRLTRAICTIQDGPGYQVFRSDEFPGFYAGNGILSDGTRPELSIEEWTAIFRQHFPETRYPHVTLVFPDGTLAPSQLEGARDRGLRVFPELLMAASVEVLACPKASDQARIAPQVLNIAQDRETLFELHLSEACSADWFDGRDSFRGLFNKTMALSDRIGMEWLALPNAEGRAGLASALAYFDEDPICRLQEVITAPTSRRRGFATLLIRETANRALQRGIPAIGLVTEAGEEGYRLYQSLGFQMLACDVTIMHY